jgi:hypothetical protein
MELFLTHYDEDMERVDEHLDQGGVVVVPSDGLGTGLSELPTRAPKINQYIVGGIQSMRKIYGQYI